MTAPAAPPKYPWKEIPRSSHALLLERAALRGDRLALLDLGFGTGEFSRRIRPRCRHLSGIEADPAAASAARDVFDDLFVGDLLEGLGKARGGPFDVIVAGDVLEHLARPEDAMGPIRALLAPGGRLLVSLPNVANVTTRLALLAGRFDYQDRGILDRTHLRFFTWKTARALLEDGGFRVVDEWATPMPVELAIPLLSRPPFLQAGRACFGLLSRAAPRLFGYQLVLEAEAA
jgi:predicted TPR repeat methyltransferase